MAKKAKSSRVAKGEKGTPTILAANKLKKLVKRADEKPNSGGSWKARVIGDAIAGEILSMKEEQGRYGPQTVLILDTPDGPRTVFTNDSMKRGLEEERAKAGKDVAIVFKGEVPTGKGRPFKLYSVAVA